MRTARALFDSFNSAPDYLDRSTSCQSLSLEWIVASSMGHTDCDLCLFNDSGAAQWAKLQTTGKYPYLNRWFQFISGIPELKETEEQYVKRKGGATGPSTEKADETSGQGDGKDGCENGDCSGQMN